MYDGSTCLETFLANMKNFVAFLQWDEETELFHLRASLRGLASQLLKDLYLDVTLAEFTCLLWKHCGTIDQEERFWTKLRTRRLKAGEELQSMYNDICHLISLALG